MTKIVDLMKLGFAGMFFVSLIILSGCASPDSSAKTIRVGYFPNITHSQAIIGMAKSWFQKELGPEVKIETKLFNAGPSVIEAIFAGELDLAYIGPNPAINGYIKSNGEMIRIVAGATSGGAGLVIRKGAGIRTIEDFHGKKIASPQLGNTQDVALRGWLRSNNLKLKEKGGDVQVVPIANPDQLVLFQKKEIDAAWTVEPWVIRLVLEGNGELFLDERSLWPDSQFVTAHVIVTKEYLEKHGDLVRKWIAAHVRTSDWINIHMDSAKIVLNGELKKMTGKELPGPVLDNAFSRLIITNDPIQSSLYTSAKAAYAEDFLGKKEPDLSRIYDLKLLQEVLAEKGMPALR